MKTRIDLKRKLNKRGTSVFIAMLLACVILIGRLVQIQIINYKEYQSLSIGQFTKEVTISAKRGTIYDANMKPLAISATVERVFISPNTIPQMTVGEYVEKLVSSVKGDKAKEEKRTQLYEVFDDFSITVSEDIARELSAILGVDKKTILEKAAKTNRADETIKAKAELEETALVREMMLKKGYSNCIHFAETTKRYYPYSTLASHVIGFTGTDNTGLAGVELYYDNILQGVNGKVIKAQNGLGQEMSFSYESYVSAKDGTDIMLTLDWTLQHILEKHLETALEDSKAENKVAGILMDVDTGEILAMATKDDFDLNSPFTLNESYSAILENFNGTEEEIRKKRSDLLYAMWSNKTISELYEPGSTFKTITSAMVLEEKLVSDTESFNCTGQVKYLGQLIHCHRTWGHGTLCFEEALQQSCNPVFIEMSRRLGTTTFYKYYRAFGYGKKTGVDLPGEAANYFFNPFTPIDAAVASFGQNFKVNMLSHLTAISAVANGGYLVTPHVLKATLDSNGNVISTYDDSVKRQVLSSDTCNYLRDYLEGAVESGGAKNAAVTGYRIAAKTGTSVKTELRTETGVTKYIASCVAFAPADDPKVAILVIVDEPVGEYYGGTVAAPIAAKVLSEALPYLGIDPQYNDEDIDMMGKTISSYVGVDVDSAKALIKKDNFEYRIIGDGNIVRAQVPAADSTLSKGGLIVLYTDTETPDQTVKVPNLIGMTAARANETLTNLGLNINIVDASTGMLEGAIVYKQSIPEKTSVLRGSIISVEFRYYEGITD